MPISLFVPEFQADFALQRDGAPGQRAARHRARAHILTTGKTPLFTFISLLLLLLSLLFTVPPLSEARREPAARDAAAAKALQEQDHPGLQDTGRRDHQHVAGM